MSSNIMWFGDLGLADLEQVGGKNSSLGRHLERAGFADSDDRMNTEEVSDAERRAAAQQSPQSTVETTRR
jgi:pyruvate, water dikinase